MKKFGKLRLPWVNLLGLVFVMIIVSLLYLRLGRDPLFDWDEGIYGELGRQLVVSKNLFVNFWNGAVWFEKPPGISWLAGLGILLGGMTSYGPRLFMPVIAGLTLLVIYRLGARKSWQHGLLSAGILATFNLFLSRARGVNVDMALLLGISTTILFLVEHRPAWLVALAVAGSVWFKGPAGLLAIAIAAPLFFTKSRSYLLSCISYLLILIVPWHLYAFLAYGSDFYRPYLLEQVLQRATTPIEFHMESRWYYFSYLYENLGAGVLLVAGLGLTLMVIQIWRDYRTKKSLRSLSPNSYLSATIIWWMLLPLGLFTLAKTRLFWYILPVYPALALLSAYAISFFDQSKTSRRVIAILSLGVAFQAMLTVTRSVEITKTSAPLSDRLVVASRLRESPAPLLVLVPRTERLAEAVLPQESRLSSSFRYGGMPSVVYYYQGPVQFFYNVDEFRAAWDGSVSPTAMVERGDLSLFDNHTILVETPTYLGIGKGLYAHR